jgi:hypothetical protein
MIECYPRRITAISSCYASRNSDNSDYLFQCFLDGTLARLDITKYGSKRHNFKLESGWNLLSWTPERYSTSHVAAVSDLFPDAILPVYAYNSFGMVYEAIDSVRAGQGFWVLSDTAVSISQGGLMTMDTIDVTLYPGWNLIGVMAVPMFADSLEALPEIMDGIYKFKGGEYVRASALDPGKGYWVLAEDTVTIRVR